MCGIIFVTKKGKNKMPVNAKALDIFENQHGRGKEGYGIVKILDNGTIKIDRSTEGMKFMWDIHTDPVNTIMVHHRTPTSTPNLTHQTHPIFVSNGSLSFDYYVVHNGMIRNDDELKEEHEKLGFIYQTAMKDGGVDKFNDSEALAIELARYIESQESEYRVEGSAAFIALQVSKKTGKAGRIFFGRHGSSPLMMAKTREQLILASENIGCDITEDVLYSCLLDNKMDLTKKKMKIAESKTVWNGSGSYDSPYYRQREIGFSGNHNKVITVETEVEKSMRQMKNRGKKIFGYDDDYDFGEADSKYKPKEEKHSGIYNDDGIEIPFQNDIDDDLPIATEDAAIAEFISTHSENILDTLDEAVSWITEGDEDDASIHDYVEMIYAELKNLNNNIKKIREEEAMKNALKETDEKKESDKEYMERKMKESNKGKELIKV